MKLRTETQYNFLSLTSDILTRVFDLYIPYISAEINICLEYMINMTADIANDV